MRIYSRHDSRIYDMNLEKYFHMESFQQFIPAVNTLIDDRWLGIQSLECESGILRRLNFIILFSKFDASMEVGFLLELRVTWYPSKSNLSIEGIGVFMESLKWSPSFRIITEGFWKSPFTKEAFLCKSHTRENLNTHWMKAKSLNMMFYYRTGRPPIYVLIWLFLFIC